MRTIQHWTPRYIRDRAADIWFRRTHPRAPWLTPAAIAILDSWLRPSDSGAEWGSGRSTLWFAVRVGRLVSVEHDPEWHARIAPQLPAWVDYRLHEDGIRQSPDTKYATAGQDIPDGSLDFVLIDGLLRDHCAMQSLRSSGTAGC